MTVVVVTVVTVTVVIFVTLVIVTVATVIAGTVVTVTYFSKKNPAYGRQSISRPMRIVAPMP